jgi:hypothetical protein
MRSKINDAFQNEQAPLLAAVTPIPAFTARQSFLIKMIGLYCLVSVTLNGFDVPVPEPDAT